MRRRYTPKVKVSPSGELYTSESELQQVCVKWFRVEFCGKFGQFEGYEETLFSIPNGGNIGGKKSKNGTPIGAAILKGEGLTSGVADLQLAVPRSNLHGLFIEMKTPVGYWEPDQRAFAKRQIALGYGYALCRRRADFEKVVKDYFAGTYHQPTIEELKKQK